MALLFVAIALGAALQSATGFGFSLLCAPILFALLDPKPAIGLLAVLSIGVNLMTLLTEGRRPRPLTREAVILVGFALPGALVGVLVLRNLPATGLQILLSGGVLTTLIVRHLMARRAMELPDLHDGPRPRPVWSAPLAGLLSGALSTSTSTSGPPLLLHLLGRGARPAVVRDTLTVCFVSLGLITPIALLVTRTTEAIPDVSMVSGLLPAVLLGHLVGRRVFAKLEHASRYEAIVTIVLLISVATGLVSVFT